MKLLLSSAILADKEGNHLFLNIDFIVSQVDNYLYKTNVVLMLEILAHLSSCVDTHFCVCQQYKNWRCGRITNESSIRYQATINSTSTGHHMVYDGQNPYYKASQSVIVLLFVCFTATTP